MFAAVKNEKGGNERFLKREMLDLCMFFLLFQKPTTNKSCYNVIGHCYNKESLLFKRDTLNLCNSEKVSRCNKIKLNVNC